MTTTSPLALSPHASLSITRIGAEELPLMRVENAVDQIDLIREIAGRHSYKPIGQFYPGVRAAVSERIAMPLVAPLLGTMKKTFGLEREPAYFECYLSIVTRQARELDPIQRLPHFDGLERGRIAVLLYLDLAKSGGTAFYRQRSTGFESIDQDRYESYRRTLEAETAQNGPPDAGYIEGDTAMFERICDVEPTPGTMIAYHGNCLHCASLPKDFLPENNAESGRLTLNLFLY